MSRTSDAYKSRWVEVTGSVLPPMGDMVEIRDSAGEAFTERLLASGVLDNFTLKTGPTVVELADQAIYL
jgi:hypothetical protein